MKTMKEYLAMLPEAERPDAEKAFAAEVVAGNPLAGIDTKEKAAEFIQKNPLFKGAYDADISRVVASHDEKFIAEKVPGLVKAEVEKLTGPEKDPVKLELNAIKKELADNKAAEARATLTAKVLEQAAAKGIPPALAKLCVRDTAEATQSALDEVVKTSTEWRDTHAEKLLKEKLGNNGQPARGQERQDPKTLKEKYDAAVKAGNGDLALILQTQMQQSAQQPVAAK